MKFVRYGKAGAEKPGMIGPDSKICDLSGHISDLSGKALAPSSLKKLAKLTDLPRCRHPLCRGNRAGCRTAVHPDPGTQVGEHPEIHLNVNIPNSD